MSHGSLVRWLVAVVFFTVSTLPSVLRAQTLPISEKQKIEALIGQVGALTDAQFVRNGSSYSATYAATFLRRKWQANDAHVTSAQDFVDKVASFSRTSGKPYLIRFNDGKEIHSRDFLNAELDKIEKRAAKTPAGRQNKGPRSLSSGATD